MSADTTGVGISQISERTSNKNIEEPTSNLPQLKQRFPSTVDQDVTLLLHTCGLQPDLPSIGMESSRSETQVVQVLSPLLTNSPSIFQTPEGVQGAFVDRRCSHGHLWNPEYSSLHSRCSGQIRPMKRGLREVLLVTVLSTRGCVWVFCTLVTSWKCFPHVDSSQ